MGSAESVLVYYPKSREVDKPTEELVESLRRSVGFSQEEIVSLSPEKLIKAMCDWRTLAVTLMTLYEVEWNGQRAAGYLEKVEDIFANYYLHPKVVKAAKKMKIDPEEHKYQMEAAMLRDEGKCYLNKAQLTGNSSLVAKAVDCFEGAIQAATENSSTWAVVIMEKEVAGKQRGKKIDWEVLSRAYQTAVELCPQAGGWNRMAAVSWSYTKEALWARRRKDLEKGLNNLKKATRNLGFNWVICYPLWDIATSLLGVTRRLTYPNE